MHDQTSHFKLLNRLCEAMAKEDPHAATQLHHDLLCSGMDRILVVRPTHPPTRAMLTRCRRCAKRPRRTTLWSTLSLRDTSLTCGALRQMVNCPT